jgi:hypothetical protein
MYLIKHISNTIYYSRGGLTEGEEVEVNRREGKREKALAV